MLFGGEGERGSEGVRGSDGEFVSDGDRGSSLILIPLR